MYFQFFILRACDHRLNYDECFFAIEIRMTNEDTLQLDNFRLRLKHKKFKMCSHDLLLKKGNYL